MKVTIDGIDIVSEGRKMLLEVAREHGISIPSLCDHPRLTPFGGCRLCLVQVKGRGRYVPACSTEVEDGMEVEAHTPELRKLREQILELILIEHPNACLICSEKESCDEKKSTIRKVGEVTGCALCHNNGRCDLQDVVAEIGIEKVNFPSVYRGLEIKRGDPFFDRDFNLCILCGRCVRVCQEVRGLSTLTFVGRGPETVVGTVLDKTLIEANCQFCGACVDACPTGSLTEKATKYERLPDRAARTVCPLCSMGCELEVKLREGRILNSQPSQDGPVNQDQACVKGRFTLREVVYSSLRSRKPLIRKREELEEATWEEALDFVAGKLKAHAPKDIALIGSSQCSLEDGFVFNRFAAEVLKTRNVYRGGRGCPLAVYQRLLEENSLAAEMNFQLGDIAGATTIFLFGANIAVSHPIVWLEVLRAVKAGAKLVIVGPTEYLFTRHAFHWIKTKPGAEALVLSALSKLVVDARRKRGAGRVEGWEGFKNSLDELSLDDVEQMSGAGAGVLKAGAALLSDGNSAVFLFGTELTSAPNGRDNLAALWNLALQTQARLVPLSLENNSRGLFELTRHASLNEEAPEAVMQAVKDGRIKALYLAAPFKLPKEGRPEFVVVQDSYLNENAATADAVLPTTTFAESEGVCVNAEGRVQRSEAIIEPLGEARPDWWIWTQLAKRLNGEGFEYKKCSAIWSAIRKQSPAFGRISWAQLAKRRDGFVRETKAKKKRFLRVELQPVDQCTSEDYPVLLSLDYNLDSYKGMVLSDEIKGFHLLRDEEWIRMNPEDARGLGAKDGDRVELESAQWKRTAVVHLSPLVAPGCAVAAFSQWEPEQMPSSNLVPVRIRTGKP